MPPWEKYGSPPQDGPWSKYGGTAPMPESPSPEPLTDREAWESSLPVRMLRGVEGPAITLLKMVGPDSIKQQLADIDRLRESGMKKRGNEGFDWGGLLGSLVPGSAIGSAVTKAIPAATAVGKIGQGALVGGVTAGAQPLPGGQDELSTDKLKQMAGGAAVGGALPVAAQGVKSFFGSNRLNPTQQATLDAGRAAGYTVPPSAVNPSGLNNTLESLAGKAAVGQEAAARNQKVTNAIAPLDVGLGKNAMLSEAVLERVRQKAGEAYANLAALNPGGELQRLRVRSKVARTMEPGPVTGMTVAESRGEPVTTGLRIGEVRDAAGKLIGMKVGKKSEGVERPLEGLRAKVTSRAQDVPGPLQGLKMSVSETRGGQPLEDLKRLRSDANAYYKHYFRSADVDSLKQAKRATAQAKAIEHDFEDRAAKAGKPELAEDMKRSRQLIAKTYDLEKALTIGDSNISAPTLGGQLDTAGEKGMSGNMLTIARMAEAFPSVMREGAKVPTAGVSGTDAAMSAMLGTIGFGAGGPAGLSAAALPLMRPLARNLVLSPTYQKYLAAGIPARYIPLIDAMTQRAVAAGGTTIGRTAP